MVNDNDKFDFTVTTPLAPIHRVYLDFINHLNKQNNLTLFPRVYVLG